MKNYKYASEVAELFDTTVPNLHYWESEGLFTVEHDAENGYRKYTLGDILNIWEIKLYRELDMPIKKVKRVLRCDVRELGEEYARQEQYLKGEIAELEEKLARVEKQRARTREALNLDKRGETEGRPDFSACRVDSFDINSMRLTLEEPYDCCIAVGEDGKCVRGIISDSGDILWKKRRGVRYMEFLLKIGMENQKLSNLEEVRSRLARDGFETGGVIARYLVLAAEKGIRYEYYRAWIEIKNPARFAQKKK